MASILNVDKIRRAAGSTDALVIDSGDRITTPTRPAFHARHTTGSTVGITGTIVFDTEDFDIEITIRQMDVLLRQLLVFIIFLLTHYPVKTLLEMH